MKGWKERNLRKWLLSLWRYLIFFLLMAFVVTCCMVLFFHEVTRVTGLVLTKEHIEQAAKLTFLNVVLLSLLCTVIDAIRRKVMVDRPVKQITRAAQRITQGDFSVRIPPLYSMDGFDQIAKYFNEMAQELSGTETLRTDFISNVSHELKTPLAVIQNYGTMLQQPGLRRKSGWNTPKPSPMRPGGWRI